MGTWGPAIFSDDLASDVRGEYRELLEDQVSDAHATTTLLQHYADLDDEEATTFWLALAAAQYRAGRLETAVRDRALRLLEDGSAMVMWTDASESTVTKRQQVLSTLHEQLTGPQLPRKTIRRPWRFATDLTAGDVLSLTRLDGNRRLLRVMRLDDTRHGIVPILGCLDWLDPICPSSAQLLALPLLPDLYRPSQALALYASRPRKRDANWDAAGFDRIARLGTDTEQTDIEPTVYLTWRQLEENITENWLYERAATPPPVDD